MAGDAAPFILTLTLDAASQAHFDALRTAHFPAHRLVVGAHVTLFHALPSDVDRAVVQDEAAANYVFQVRVKGLRFLGKGVAFSLESEPLREMRKRLRQNWASRLTAQDGQPWQPHVTIQNKAQPTVARMLYDSMSSGFMPYDVEATGLSLWIYRNGPWEAAGTYPFSKAIE